MPAYFETMGIGLVEGRDFSTNDDANSASVAIINQAMAKRLWPNQPVIGKTFSVSGPAGPYLRIVGIAATSKYRTIGETETSYFYLPLGQCARKLVFLIASTNAAPSSILGAMRGAVQNIDPDLAIIEATTLDKHIEALTYLPTAASILFAVLGLVSALLAAVGTYGVLAFFVDRHQRDIGIRIAVGATSQEIIAIVVRQLSGAAVTGLAAGVCLALLGTRLAASLLFGVAPSDPVALAGALGVTCLGALGACWYPAFRASRIDPIRTLKAE
jgi:ABC-type antimicrobial peptide transport system permease subunit